jgi:hypothetical protein
MEFLVADQKLWILTDGVAAKTNGVASSHGLVSLPGTDGVTTITDGVSSSRQN